MCKAIPFCQSWILTLLTQKISCKQSPTNITYQFNVEVAIRKLHTYLTNKKRVTAFKSNELVEIEKNIENISRKFAAFQVAQSDVALILYMTLWITTNHIRKSIIILETISERQRWVLAKNQDWPPVQSCQQSGIIHPQITQALGPCTPSDATAPRKSTAIRLAWAIHSHPNQYI